METMTNFQNQRLSVNEEGDEKAFIIFAKDIFGFANRNRRHRRSKQNGDDDGDDPEEKNIQSIHHNKVDETTITKLDKDQKTDGEEMMTAKDGGGTKPAADNSSVDLLRHLSGIDIENPTLFSETFSMAVASAAIFPLAEVREAARAEKIDAPGIIPLPVKTMTIVQTFVDHKDELKKLLKPADFELMELLYDLLFPASDVIESNGSLLWDIVNDASLHYFGDDDSKSECVYFLLLNPTLNRILLCFRGSITTKDWIQDSKNVVGKIHNPLFMRSDQGETLGVHLGFREYLYSRSTNASLLNLKADLSIPVLSIAKQISASARSAHSTENRHHAVDDKNDGREESIDENGENYSSAVSSATDQSDQILTPITPSESKQSLTSETSAHPQARCRLEKILDEIDNLRRENRGYRIYVSGHSLGGALALLTALEVAALWGVPDNPVTFVGIGNPRAATIGFRDVVERLEREGKMRCLCVHNHMDIVPMLPASAFAVRKSVRFCQVGFEMLLDGNYGDSFEMRYCPHFYNSKFSHFTEKGTRFGLAVLQAPKIAGRHHWMTYLNILRRLEGPLKKLYLNDYYNAVVHGNLHKGSEAKRSPTKVTGTDWKTWV